MIAADCAEMTERNILLMKVPQMIEELVHEIAGEMSVPLTTIQLVDGHRLGLRGSYLLKMTVNDTIASTLIHQEKLADTVGGLDSERTRYEIRNAMSRLQILLER